MPATICAAAVPAVDAGSSASDIAGHMRSMCSSLVVFVDASVASCAAAAAAAAADRQRPTRRCCIATGQIQCPPPQSTSFRSSISAQQGTSGGIRILPCLAFISTASLRACFVQLGPSVLPNVRQPARRDQSIERILQVEACLSQSTYFIERNSSQKTSAVSQSNNEQTATWFEEYAASASWRSSRV